MHPYFFKNTVKTIDKWMKELGEKAHDLDIRYRFSPTNEGKHKLSEIEVIQRRMIISTMVLSYREIELKGRKRYDLFIRMYMGSQETGTFLCIWTVTFPNTKTDTLKWLYAIILHALNFFQTIQSSYQMNPWVKDETLYIIDYETYKQRPFEEYLNSTAH